MSDPYGHQREVRPRRRPGNQPIPSPDLSARSDDHVEDLAAAFALGALDPAERERVAFHISFCPRCAAAVDQDLRTAGLLPFSVAGGAAPSPDVKAALFSRIGHVTRAESAARMQAALPPAAAWPAPVAQPAPVAAAAAAPQAVPLAAEPRRGGLARFGSLVSVPLLAALIATGFWGVSLRDQVAQQGQRIDMLSSQVANFGSGATTLQLSPGRALPQAEGQLVLGADEKTGMLSVDLNSDAAAGSYAIWAVDASGALKPVAEFTVDASGRGDAEVALDQPFSSYEAVQIQPLGVEGKANGKTVVLTSSYPNLGSTGSELDSLP
ncbi:MAG: zf-HC2 domain-containing protein [Chloroflexota bacterium]